MTYRNGVPFAFWCHKVLPLVYDESLSYYEFLCKIAKILQEVMEHDIEQDENIEQNRRAIEAINTALESIREDIESIQRVNRLQELAITANTDDINRLSDDIAEQYDENKSYDIGDFAMLVKELYRKVRNTGNFEDDWEKVNIADFVSTALGDIESIQRVNRLQELAITANTDDINRLSDDIAEQYDENESYDIGDFAMLVKELYRKVRNTGNFEDDWEKTSVAEIVYLINSGLDNIRRELITLTNNFADEYAENTSYNIGRYCIYNGILYKCVEAIPSPSGEFDPTKWTRTKESIELTELWDECSNIRLALDGLVVNFMGNLALPFSNYEGTTVTYTVGDLVTDYQWLYKCIQGYSFSQVVPTPANDRVHWQQTTIADNLSSGGGGGNGNVNVSPYDSTKEYLMGEFAEFAGTIYECIANSATGSFDANKWSAIEPMSQLAGLQRINYYIDSAIDEDNQLTFDEGDYAVYRNTNNVYTLLRAKVDGATDPTDIGDFERTSVIGELGDIRNTVTGFKKTTFDENEVYNKGDIVFYNGVIVECKNDGVTGEYNVRDWNYGNTIFSELAKLITTINNLNLYNGNVVDRYNTNVTEVI